METHEGIRTARRLARTLQARGYPIVEVYLFGSVAKGLAGEQSDVDVAVVYEPFRASRGEENTEFFLASKDIDLRMETVCLHPEDFGNRYSTLIEEIERYGIPVAGKRSG